MELIDRYLQAVRFWLPSSQQDDIVAELAEDLRVQVEERESELGHPLTEGDAEALLRKRGSPMLVANRYLPQRWLIGPALFPVYLVVLKIVTLCVVGFIGFGWLVRIISQAFTSVSNPVAGVFSGATFGTLTVAWFAAATMVTLVFAILERSRARTDIFENWKPRKLPPFRHPRMIPRSSSILEIAANLCVVAWWSLAVHAALTLHIGTVTLGFSPRWAAFFWGILLLTLGNAGLGCANLLRPWRTPARGAFRIALDVAGSVLICWLIKSNVLIAAAWPGATPARSAAAVNLVNLWLERVFPLVVAISIVILAANVYRLVRVSRKTGPAAAAARDGWTG